MLRISEKFKDLKNKGEKALVGFVTAGDPDPEMSVDIVVSMANSGVDIIEFGIPFSDPTADGPVIQRASARSLDSGTNIEKVFEMVKKIRKRTNIPLVLFTYYNPVFKYGEEKFCKKAVSCGANGILIVDLPFEEHSVLDDFDSENFPKINLAAPTTSKERMEAMGKKCSGFIYLVSKIGVTGSAGLNPELTRSYFEKLRKFTNLPICVGFGIKTGEDVKNIADFADGVVIGSAFESLIEENLGRDNLLEIIESKTREYKRRTFAN